MNYSTQTRAWIDFDSNKSVLDAAGNIQFNEVLGGTSNFGQITRRLDPNLLRGYNWEYSTSVQHQLMERISVTAGYYRRNFYNLDVLDNPTGADRLDQVSRSRLDRSRCPCPRGPSRLQLSTPNRIARRPQPGTFSELTSTSTRHRADRHMLRDKLLLFGHTTDARRPLLRRQPNTPSGRQRSAP